MVVCLLLCLGMPEPGLADDTLCDRSLVGQVDDLHAAVEESPPGTRFCLSGTFALTSPVFPKDGQVFTGPAEIVSSGAQTAFDLAVSSIDLSAADVVIEDLDISGFYRGIECWLGAVVRGSEIHHNERNAIGCGLKGLGGVTIERNHLHHNGSIEEVGAGAAGVKIANGTGVVIRSNLVESTIGNGLWCDAGCGQIEIVGNTIVGSTRKGIFYEISRGPALVTANTVRENNCSPVHWGNGNPDCPRGNTFGPQGAGTAGGGISATSSTNVTITENVLGGNMVAGVNFHDDSRLYDPPFAIAVERNRPNGDAILRCGEWGITCADNEDVQEPPPPDLTPPSVPGGLSATATRDTVTLVWEPASDDTAVTGYEVWRDGAQVGTPTSNGFTDDDVSASTTYTYVVHARDAAENVSGPSDELVVTTPGPDVTPPSPPADLVAEATVDSVSLSWTPSTDDDSGVASYEVWRDGAPIGTTEATAYVDDSVTPGTTPTYAVRAIDGAGNASELSDAISVTVPMPDVTPPTVPSGLAAEATVDAVTLTWTPSTDDDSGVDSYEVWRDGAPIATTEATAYVDDSVTPGTTPTYAVRAIDGAGNASELSAPVVTNIPVPEPALLFSDGFETGDTSRWSTVARVVVQSQVVRTGSFAARAATTGVPTYATKDLGAEISTAELSIAVRFASQGKSIVSFAALHHASSPVITLFRANNGRLGFRNNVTGRNVTGSTAMPLNAWHTVRLRVTISGSSSTVEVWLNDARLADLSRTQSLGTRAIRHVQIGETTKNRSYDLTFDDVVVAAP